MLRKGDRAQVATPAGLRMRRGPGTDKPLAMRNGKPIVRPKGWGPYPITKARNVKGGERWVKFEHYWMAARYLEEAGARDGNRVESPVPGYGMTTHWRKRPKDNTYWQARGYHTGADFAAPEGANTVAVCGGTVHCCWDPVLGNVALLYADNGDTYWHCHLRSFWGRDGRRVEPGTRIGKVGQTGSGALGPHLHLERRNGHSSSWAGIDLDPMEGWQQ
jgi:murein DD-endopeptidase MepM/ murein hydrolase activator NlpD